MRAQAARGSGLTIPQLLPRPARKNRNARVQHGRCSIAAAVPPAATAQAAPLPAIMVRVGFALLPFICNPERAFVACEGSLFPAKLSTSHQTSYRPQQFII